MRINNKKKIIVTHSGSFHADDVFACAALSILEKGKVKIIRTRDEKIIKTGNYVVDVGGIYDPAKNRFDHHQREGAGKRPAPSGSSRAGSREVEGENGIPYASFGLVWKKFGEEICGSKEVALTIDKKLVQPTDAGDSGVLISKNLIEDVSDYDISNVFDTFLPTWKEGERDEKNVDEQFLKVVDLAKKILEREIIREQAKRESDVLVQKTYEESEDKRLIILKRYLPWKRVLAEYLEPLYVISPREEDKWQAEAVIIAGEKFKRRKYFSESWAGLRDEELANVTGVKDALFCHKDLFICVAKSYEGAIKLAKLALESKS